jgi:hypothetical protein
MEFAKEDMKSFLNGLSLLGIVIMLILFFLLKEGAEYLLESGNADVLVIVASMFIAAIVTLAIMTAIKNRKKEKPE